MAAPPTIVLEAVSFRYGTFEALSNVDVSFSGGEIISLIGPNGSGKTTLLRLLAGLEQPSQGRLERSGDVTVAYVGQLQQHHPWMPLTVGEVITTARYRDRGLWRRLRGTDHEICRASADRLGVSDLWSRRFTDLSGGQRQRAVIARALAADASVLLFDEPITGLDLASQQVITDMMQAERSAGRLVVFSTHHLEETRICDRVLLVRGGVLADGPPTSILTPHNLGMLFGSHLVRASDDDAVLVIDDHEHTHLDPSEAST